MGTRYPNYVRKVGSNIILSHSLSGTTPSTPYINLANASNFYFDVPATKEARFSEAGTNHFSLKKSGNDAQLITKLSNANLEIVCAGTGKLKYGTYAAITTETNAGYIEIVDSGGTTRKVCIVA
jgi:hypothetical protein